MNQDNIHDALNMLDDELINEVSKLRDIRKKRKSMSVRLGAIAACLCLFIVSVYRCDSAPPTTAMQRRKSS